jgi:hypothetical protein
MAKLTLLTCTISADGITAGKEYFAIIARGFATVYNDRNEKRVYHIKHFKT